MGCQNKDFYVYCHQKKDDGKCFYIGKGKGKRAYSKNNRNIHWKRTVDKHGGFDVVILVNGITEEKAFELEVNFIRQIGIENLCNMTEGGEGMSGYINSDETRKKRSESMKGLLAGEKHPMYGKSHSEETRRKQSDSMKGKNVGKSRKGKYTGDKNPNYGKFGENSSYHKQVEQYTNDGLLLRTWGSIVDAAIELKINNTSISKCCGGRQKSAGGFIFKYKL